MVSKQNLGENTLIKSKIVVLDIIRICAAISIMLYHYTQRYDEIIGHSTPLNFNWKYGGSAVCIFFFLSGFLAIYHYKEQTFLTSIKKKWIRLYPTYLACLLISALITFLFLKQRWCGFFPFLINLTMLQSLFGIVSVDGAYWTLWPEIVFYFYVAIWQKKKLNYNSLENYCLLWILLSFLDILISFQGPHAVILSKLLNKICVVNNIIPFMVGGYAR